MSKNTGVMIAVAVLLVAGAVVGVMTIGGGEDGNGAEGTKVAEGRSGKARSGGGAKATKRETRPTRTRRDRDGAAARPPKGTVSTLSAAEATKQARAWISDALQTTDPAKRAAAIAAIEESLLGGHEMSAYAALHAYLGIHQRVRLDRRAFRTLVEPYLDAEDPGMRRAAWYTFVHTDLLPEDHRRLRALLSDPAPEVRKSATQLMQLMADGDLSGEVGTMVLGMLNSESKEERIDALRGMSGARLSPELEARLIELSKSGDAVEVHSVIQYSLGRIKEKSPAVVERLVELMSDTSVPKNAGPAAQGLRSGVPEESYAEVADAAIDLLEESHGKVMWGQAIDLLGRYGSEEHRPRIEEMIGDPDMDVPSRRSLQMLSQKLRHER